jgi:hypothetical protein
MDFIFLMMVMVFTLTVFGVDVFQKRRQYLNDRGS